MSGRPISECRNPWEWAHVTATGDLRPCCFALRPLGNVVAAGSFDAVWNGPELSDVRRSLVAGHVPPSCRGAGCRFARDTERAFGLEAYRLDYALGTVVTPSGSCHPLLEGWSWPEPWGVWSDGPRARLALRVAEDFPGDLGFAFHAFAYLPGPDDRLAVTVKANGQSVAAFEWLREGSPGDATATFGGDVERRVVVPRTAVRDASGLLVLELEIDPPRAPTECGHHRDDRRLGLGLTAFRLVALPPAASDTPGARTYRLGTVIRPSREPRHLAAGWSWPEAWGIWSDTARSRLVLHPEHRSASGLALHLLACASLPAGREQLDVAVEANGIALGALVFRPSDGESFGRGSGIHGAELERRLVIPERVVRAAPGALTIDFLPAAPSAFGLLAYWLLPLTRRQRLLTLWRRFLPGDRAS